MKDDDVLIKLKRQYGKDEYVAALLKKIEGNELAIKILMSQRNDFEKKLNKIVGANGTLNDVTERLKEASHNLKKVITNSDLYKSAIAKTKKAEKQNADLKKVRDDLLLRLNSRNT